MDSWFLMISETDNFLQLPVDLLEEILSRSSLLVTTEIEVYHVVNKWINYNFKERQKFAKRLLNKIRLPLLGENTLKTIVAENSCFRKNKESLAVVNDILNGNFGFYMNKPSKFLTARYCGHDSFDILYFGGKGKSFQVTDDRILQIKHSDQFSSLETASSLTKKRYNSSVAYLRGNVYIFGGFDLTIGWRQLVVKEVEMYSHLTKTCKVVANVEDVNDKNLVNYAVCGFMDKIYLIGGTDNEGLEKDSCIEFDTKGYSWKHKSKMIEKRESPDACVFEEKIIVSGGMRYTGGFVNFVNNYDDYLSQTLKTVEAYDPINDSWTEFAAMNYSRCNHKSVVVKNKLFVIAGGTDINEIYDSASKKFTVLKPSFSLYDIRERYPLAAFSIGHKLFVYFSHCSRIFCFDTTKGKWHEKACEPTKQPYLFSATQVPRL